MHEIGIMQGTLDLALETAKAASAREIVSIHLRVGVMTGLVPDALQFAFEALREGTMAARARLEIETVARQCWCEHCLAEFEAVDWRECCPTCRAPGRPRPGGDRLELTSIEVE